MYLDSCFSRIPPAEFAPYTMEVLITIFSNRVKKSSCPYGQEADESTNHLQRQRSSPTREMLRISSASRLRPKGLLTLFSG